MKVVGRREATETLSEQARALLRRRAERLHEKQATTDEDQAVLWVAEFPVGDERYAIPLEQVRAAVPLRMVTPVPLAPSHVIGVLRYEGQLISAFSLVSLLGVRGWQVDPEVLLVVETGAGRLTAIDCEQIPKASAIPLTHVEEARALGAGPLVDITTSDMVLVSLIDDLALLFTQRLENHDAH